MPVCSHCFAADGDSVRSAKAAPADRLVLIVRGASGTPEYGQLFDTWSERWESAALQGGTQVLRIGPKESGGGGTSQAVTEPIDADRNSIELALREAAKEAQSKQLNELWIVLIGHGTFDGRLARFNLRGQDISAEELANWLNPVSCPVAIANCASASGPFLKALAGPDRVVITATKAGSENNFARFGEYLSAAVGDSTFDLDKDGQTSLFEAYLSASRRTDGFYETEGRLATEHALLDDNSDGLGIRADLFRGIRLVKKVQGGASVDGRLAHQFHLVRSDSERQLSSQTRQLRDKLELAVIQLRDRKQSFDSEDAYYAQLEDLLVKLAQAYAGFDSTVETPGKPIGARLK
ncbi:MAG: hypothetical protein HQ518_26820 [Rhodopirellula sp.]|nr:hypothetical protein [Rhodopirellula sp.]